MFVKFYEKIEETDQHDACYVLKSNPKIFIQINACMERGTCFIVCQELPNRNISFREDFGSLRNAMRYVSRRYEN